MEGGGDQKGGGWRRRRRRPARILKVDLSQTTCVLSTTSVFRHHSNARIDGCVFRKVYLSQRGGYVYSQYNCSIPCIMPSLFLAPPPPLPLLSLLCSLPFALSPAIFLSTF